MSTPRIDIFKQMLVSDPINTSVLFGLAKEYEKAGLNEDLIETLNRYLEVSDDEGNAYGMLACAYERIGQRDKARQVYQRGIQTPHPPAHPSIPAQYPTTLPRTHKACPKK